MRTEKQQLRSIYQWAKSRCTNPNVKQYKDYGGRGIQFKFDSFNDFVNHIGNRPVGYMLDRINNDKHYEIGNIHWVTRKEQNQNKGSYDNSTTKITKISIINPRGKYKTLRYCVRVYINHKRIEIYKGASFELATFVLEEYNDKKNRLGLHKSS